jgi:broad specificity phosphatase PhoE
MQERCSAVGVRLMDWVQARWLETKGTATGVPEYDTTKPLTEHGNAAAKHIVKHLRLSKEDAAEERPRIKAVAEAAAERLAQQTTPQQLARYCGKHLRALFPEVGGPQQWGRGGGGGCMRWRQGKGGEGR